MKEKLLEMLELQDSLNKQTCGEDWTSGLTDKGRTIDWKRCIILESAEAINSFNWKHWKDINGSNDENNIKIEIVDIWHFIMSHLIKEVKNKEEIVEELVGIYNYNFGDKEGLENLDNENRIKIFEHLIFTVSSNYGIYSSSKVFFDVLFSNNMDFDELYNLYIMKNILNKFRQEHGYKEGTYVKIWNGKEDNEVALEIIREGIKSSEDLYSKLENKYSLIA